MPFLKTSLISSPTPHAQWCSVHFDITWTFYQRLRNFWSTPNVSQSLINSIKTNPLFSSTMRYVGGPGNRKTHSLWKTAKRDLLLFSIAIALVTISFVPKHTRESVAFLPIRYTISATTTRLKTNWYGAVVRIRLWNRPNRSHTRHCDTWILTFRCLWYF